MGECWREKRMRQPQMPPVRNSLRELPRTAQVFARSAEPAPTPALLMPAITESTKQPRISRISRISRIPFVIRLPAEALREGGSFSKHFPPEKFPRATALAAARRNQQPPVMDGHGNWSPETNQLESSKKRNEKNINHIKYGSSGVLPLQLAWCSQPVVEHRRPSITLQNSDAKYY
jgi:hypothetical protein